MQFILSCAAGLESIAKKEIEIAGYKVTMTYPTIVRFTGDQTAIAKINLRSRVGNKLFLELGKKHITDFDGLFDLVSQIDWSMYIQHNPILVTAASKKSQLTSTPAIQSIAKKAIVKKILANRHCEGNEAIQSAVQIASSQKSSSQGRTAQNNETLFEDVKLEPVEIFVYLENNECSILLNTTGDSLHKRGYKQATGEAPINESLAAGLLLLSGWKFSEPLYDFFCGSGTIVIEAAMIAKNIAPGILRTFAFERFARYDPKYLKGELETAKNKMMLDKHHTIIASDIDPEMIKIAQENAKNAGVEKYIHFETKDIKDYVDGPQLVGAMVSNPPYGLRLNIVDAQSLYKTIAELFKKNPQLHGGIITSYQQFDEMKGSGNRKKSPLYNGGEQCRFYKKSLL